LINLAALSVEKFGPEMDIPDIRKIIPHLVRLTLVKWPNCLKAAKTFIAGGPWSRCSHVAERPIKKLAEKLKAPVANTLLGKGEFPENPSFSLGMFGHARTVYANQSIGQLLI